MRDAKYLEKEGGVKNSPYKQNTPPLPPSLPPSLPRLVHGKPSPLVQMKCQIPPSHQVQNQEQVFLARKGILEADDKRRVDEGKDPTFVPAEFLCRWG